MGYPPLMREGAPLIGVIGGSGLYKLDNLHVIKTISASTPWGSPSSPITIAKLDTAKGPITVAFISRHGPAHNIAPSNVPARANIAALKHLGVKAIVAFSAVGSLREEVRPGDIIVPDQIIDRTKGIRPSTFFDGAMVGHAMFGEPFDKQLSDDVPRLHKERTLVVMEGPQFSTRAESNMYRSYALVCTSTDYDAWRMGEAPVTVEEVMKTLTTNASLSKHITASILEPFMRPSLPQSLYKLKYILPAYFPYDAPRWKGEHVNTEDHDDSTASEKV
ncbi:nucleoside phosphorylase domain-containing protein [Leucosporidium creatinivorum]|uniref:S-methyl-5'-thioadenosine phosphorylase n=1 Tax=Leucosporidium creatinivorum TaxID=106004 RepID=A0A1Y2G345_9BASI|nr:nucleoside phosphorylase domain-containing protein [Leucosporidium creatinivorum]